MAVGYLGAVVADCSATTVTGDAPGVRTLRLPRGYDDTDCVR